MKIPRSVVFEVARGFRGRSGSCFKLARVRAMKALLSSYLQRQQRYRRYRVLWIQHMNAASREWALPYSWLMCGLRRQNVALDRKSLATLAQTEPVSFRCIVDEARRGATFAPFKQRDVTGL